MRDRTSQTNLLTLHKPSWNRQGHFSVPHFSVRFFKRPTAAEEIFGQKYGGQKNDFRATDLVGFAGIFVARQPWLTFDTPLRAPGHGAAMSAEMGAAPVSSNR
jgi:hypothetical protein